MFNQFDENQVKEELVSARMVAALMEQPGWKIVEKYFANILSVILEQLKIEKNPQEMLRLQERYRAFETMLVSIEAQEDLKLMYEKQLADLMEQKEFDKVYGL